MREGDVEVEGTRRMEGEGKCTGLFGSAAESSLSHALSLTLISACQVDEEDSKSIKHYQYLLSSSPPVARGDGSTLILARIVSVSSKSLFLRRMSFCFSSDFFFAGGAASRAGGDMGVGCG